MGEREVKWQGMVLPDTEGVKGKEKGQEMVMGRGRKRRKEAPYQRQKQHRAGLGLPLSPASDSQPSRTGFFRFLSRERKLQWGEILVASSPDTLSKSG